MRNFTKSDHKTWEQLEAELFADPKFTKEWQRLEPVFQIKDKIVEARVNKKITQQELAKRMKTGQAAISRVESGKVSPSIDWVARLVRALDTEITLTFR